MTETSLEDVIFWGAVAAFSIVVGALAWNGYQLFQSNELTDAKDIVSIAASVATVFLVLLTVWQTHRTKQMFEVEYERDKTRYKTQKERDDERYKKQQEADAERFEREYRRNIDLFKRERDTDRIDRELRGLDEAKQIVSAVRSKYLSSKNRAKSELKEGAEFRVLHKDDVDDLKEWLKVLRGQSPNLIGIEDSGFYLNHIESEFPIYQSNLPVADDEIRYALDDLIADITYRHAELTERRDRLGEL